MRNLRKLVTPILISNNIISETVWTNLRQSHCNLLAKRTLCSDGKTRKRILKENVQETPTIKSSLPFTKADFKRSVLSKNGNEDIFVQSRSFTTTGCLKSSADENGTGKEKDPLTASSASSSISFPESKTAQSSSSPSPTWYYVQSKNIEIKDKKDIRDEDESKSIKEALKEEVKIENLLNKDDPEKNDAIDVSTTPPSPSKSEVVEEITDELKLTNVQVCPKPSIDLEFEDIDSPYGPMPTLPTEEPFTLPGVEELSSDKPSSEVTPAVAPAVTSEQKVISFNELAKLVPQINHIPLKSINYNLDIETPDITKILDNSIKQNPNDPVNINFKTKIAAEVTLNEKELSEMDVKTLRNINVNDIIMEIAENILTHITANNKNSNANSVKKEITIENKEGKSE